jgi:hypothetical protein
MAGCRPHPEEHAASDGSILRTYLVGLKAISVIADGVNVWVDSPRGDRSMTTA